MDTYKEVIKWDGRGASSGSNNIKALDIEGTTYRIQKNGYITDMIGDNPRKANLTLNQIKERAEKAGYKVTTYNAKQLKEYDKKRKEEKKRTEELLEAMSTKDRTKSYNRRGGH